MTVGKNLSQRHFCVAGMTAAIALGLGSRHYGHHLPPFIAEYAGDTFWGMALYFLISFVIPRSPILRKMVVTLCIAYAVEFSQLYKAPWIETIRQTTLGGLILGFEFIWTDLVCYTAGVVAASSLEYLEKRGRDSFFAGPR